MTGGRGGGEGSLYRLDKRPPAEGGVGGTADEGFQEDIAAATLLLLVDVAAFAKPAPAAAFFRHSSQSEPPVHSTSSHSESSWSVAE